MTSIRESIKSPHIKIALTTGASILLMAYFSKKVLPAKIDYILLAIPPFIATIFEMYSFRYKNGKIVRTCLLNTAILVSAAIIILLYML